MIENCLSELLSVLFAVRFLSQCMVATTEAATLKSRYQREVSELRDQLQRANISSERDQALREKVFNEAKAEVIALNKKVDESWRKHLIQFISIQKQLGIFD